MKKLVLTLFVALIGTGLPTVYGQSSKKKKKSKQKNEIKKPENSKTGIQAYEKIIKKTAVSDLGLFTTHLVGDNFYYEIPD